MLNIEHSVYYLYFNSLTIWGYSGDGVICDLEEPQAGLYIHERSNSYLKLNFRRSKFWEKLPMQILSSPLILVVFSELNYEKGELL